MGGSVFILTHLAGIGDWVVADFIVFLQNQRGYFIQSLCRFRYLSKQMEKMKHATYTDRETKTEVHVLFNTRKYLIREYTGDAGRRGMRQRLG